VGGNLTKIKTLSNIIFAKAYYIGPIGLAKLEAKMVFNEVITPVILKPVDYITLLRDFEEYYSRFIICSFLHYILFVVKITVYS
jgi:hypothetical protein